MSVAPLVNAAHYEAQLMNNARARTSLVFTKEKRPDTQRLGLQLQCTQHTHNEPAKNIARILRAKSRTGRHDGPVDENGDPADPLLHCRIIEARDPLPPADYSAVSMQHSLIVANPAATSSSTSVTCTRKVTPVNLNNKIMPPSCCQDVNTGGIGDVTRR